jgi:nitrate/nitrite transporter NarK
MVRSSLYAGHLRLTFPQSGIVGGMGNLGGIVCALVFRLQPVPIGKAFWITGIIAMVCRTRLLFVTTDHSW